MKIESIIKKAKVLKRFFRLESSKRNRKRKKIRSLCYSIGSFNRFSVFETNQNGELIREGGAIEIYKRERRGF